MGPNDPFYNATQDTSSPAQPSSPGPVSLPVSGKRLGLGVGALIGLGLGLVHVFVDFQHSMILLGWIAVGTVLAWMIQGLLGGRLDLSGAFKALIKRG